MYKMLMCSLLALASFGAQAKIQSDAPVFSPEKGLDLNVSFAMQRSAILAALNDGKTYVEIDPEDSSRVRTSLDRISHLLEGKKTVGELNASDRVDVFNEQELINALLARAHDESRLVCRREKTTGSNRPTNVCVTVAERRRIREETQSSMKNWRSAEPPTETR